MFAALYLVKVFTSCMETPLKKHFWVKDHLVRGHVQKHAPVAAKCSKIRGETCERNECWNSWSVAQCPDCSYSLLSCISVKHAFSREIVLKVCELYLIIVLKHGFSCSIIRFSQKYFLTIFLLFRALEALFASYSLLSCISVKNAFSSEILLKILPNYSIETWFQLFYHLF